MCLMFMNEGSLGILKRRTINNKLRNTEGFILATSSIAGQKWWKIGAAAFLSLGLLTACGGGDDAEDENMEEEVDQELEEEED